MKIAIFHDYMRVLGGAEKLVLILAKNIGADIITSELDKNILKHSDIQNVNIITLGKKTLLSSLLPAVSRKRFSQCDFKDEYDFFIFSGNFSIYASKNHSPNMWYCHTPLRGLYDLKENKST
jgi:hypothetical protein